MGLKEQQGARFGEDDMEFPRRRFLGLAAAAAAFPAPPRLARAQSYPVRPVQLTVYFAAGGGNDIIARLMGQWLSERLGQQFVILNRPGGGGNIGTESVVRADPDGYSLLFISTSNATNATLYEKLGFDFIRDIAPVACISREPNVMVINPSVPVKSVAEFIDYAKANPGKINYASAGIGTSQHMAGELFKMMTGINMVHIPHRGSAPALTSVLGGTVQLMFVSMPSVLEYIRADKLRALAVTSSKRSERLPDVPTVAETVAGFEAGPFYGMGAPRNTPPEIVERLNAAVNAGLSDPKFEARLTDLGCTPLPGSSAQFAKLIADETDKWAKVIKFANIKPE
jgi:tripartite-type tricarboxylate transporter receptor subunit TctC